MKLNFSLLLMFLGFQILCKAQTPLTLSDAIRMGIQNNYDIRIARTDSMIVSNDAHPGNAGMLPSVNLNGATNKASTDINQKYATGLELNRNNVGSSTTSGSVILSWTLFDGFKMFATYGRLKEIEARGEWTVRKQMEESVAAIIAAYFNLARQQGVESSLKQVIRLYEERVEIAQTRLEAGNGSKADLLQAKVDLNEQRSQWMKQQANVKNALSELNILLGAEAGKIWDITDEFELRNDVKAEVTASELAQNNVDFLLNASDQRIIQYQRKEILALRYPKIGIQSGYNYNSNQSQAGFALLNRSNGFNYGLSLSWNLYGGGQVKRSLEDADLNATLARQRYEKLLLEQQEKLIQARVNYRTAMALLELETETDTLASENAQIMLDRFELGESTTLELKDAQNSLINAKIRFENARYDAKVAETELLRIEGKLLK